MDAIAKDSLALTDTRRDRVALGALWVVVTAYNLFKPFHMDDTVHLDIARWILMHPLHPMQGVINWYGVSQPFSALNQPHLYFYVLAAWGGVFGFSEPSVHALQSLFALACIVALYRIARRIVPEQAVWVTALVVLGPAFIAEQNVMVDVPLLALWLLFFDRLLDDGKPTSRYALAGLLCGAAILVKYSSLVLIPIMAASLLLERRRAQAWAVLIPVGVIGLWSAFNLADYGGIHIAAREAGGSVAISLPERTLAWVVALGGLTPLGLMMPLQLVRLPVRAGRVCYAAIVLVFVVLATFVVMGTLDPAQSGWTLWAIFVVNAVLAAGGCIPGRRPDRTDAILLLWLAGTAMFYILAAPFMAARHILLILPPLTLLLARRWPGLVSPAGRQFAMGLTILVSAGCCLSDWRAAAFFQDEARDIAAALPTGHGQVWESGHWGWQWYAERAGFTPLDVQAVPMQRGDILVVADTVNHQELQRPVHVRPLWQDAQDQPLLSLVCTAPFYVSDAWTGPWLFSTACTNRISVYQVLAPAP